MSDEATQATEAASAETTEEPTLENLKAEVEKWKNFSRKHEDNAKANKAAADELQRIKDLQKTAEEKAAEELSVAKAAAKEATERLLRYEVAAAKNVPAALLSGSTKEELEAAADALQNWRGAQAENQPQSTKQFDLKQGNQGASVKAAPNPNDNLRRFMR